MKECKGLTGKLFGHKYMPRYSYGNPTIAHGKGFSAAEASMLIESSRPATYIYSMCERCGDIAKNNMNQEKINPPWEIIKSVINQHDEKLNPAWGIITIIVTSTNMTVFHENDKYGELMISDLTVIFPKTQNKILTSILMHIKSNFELFNDDNIRLDHTEKYPKLITRPMNKEYMEMLKNNLDDADLRYQGYKISFGRDKWMD